jgi:hypothetical protein
MFCAIQIELFPFRNDMVLALPCRVVQVIVIL